MPPQKMMKSYKLPKNLLEMKFMKKTKEKEEKQREDEDRQTMFSHEITNGMINEGAKFIEEPSLVPLLGLREGRFSFRGMNPDIEKLMKSEELIKKEEEEKRLQESKEKCVTDIEMAQHYGTLSNTMANKFKSKRFRSQESNQQSNSSQDIALPSRKKTKFMKPEVDDYK